MTFFWAINVPNALYINIRPQTIAQNLIIIIILRNKIMLQNCTYCNRAPIIIAKIATRQNALIYADYFFKSPPGSIKIELDAPMVLDLCCIAR